MFIYCKTTGEEIHQHGSEGFRVYLMPLTFQDMVLRIGEDIR